MKPVPFKSSDDLVPHPHPGEDPFVGDPLFVQSAARTMRVLDGFAAATGPMSLSDIAAATGINRSAAQRIVHTLRRLGYLIPGEGGTGFLPGPRVLDLAYAQLRLHPWIAQASGPLIELRRSVQERVDLSLRDDLRMVYALRQQSKRETWFATLVGHSVPIWQHMTPEERALWK